MKRNYKPLLIAIIVALVCTGAELVIYLKFFRVRPAFYTGFNITIPEKYQLIGIDVSKHQGKIFWDEVAKMRDQNRPISFVFIKATEGGIMQDRCFANNWADAHETGLLCGAYHYFHPAQGAIDQAANFLRQTAFRKGDIRPVLDVEVDESMNSSAIRDSICRWLTVVGKRYHTTPIIYTSASFYKKHFQGYFDDFPVWIAHYRVQQPNIKSDFQLWQFNDGGRVNGIDGEVDFNVFNGDSTALRSMLIR